MRKTKLLLNINKRVTALGIPMYKLAAIAGVSSSAAYKLLKGKALPTPSTYARIIDALGLKINNTLFLKLLEARRKTLRISTVALSERVGFSYATLYRLKNGTMLSTKAYCKIAKKLNLPLEKLIEWSSKS